MVDEAKKFEEQDKENLEKTQAKNDLENNLYRISSSLSENEEKLKDVDQSKIDAVKTFVEETKEWLESSPLADKEEYEKRSKKLDSLFHPISTQMYQGQGEAGGDNEDQMDEEMSGGSGGGMPNLSPEMMGQFQEMMKDPAKRAQMENMVKGFMGGKGKGSTGGKNKKSGPTVEEVD